MNRQIPSLPLNSQSKPNFSLVKHHPNAFSTFITSSLFSLNPAHSLSKPDFDQLPCMIEHTFLQTDNEDPFSFISI